MLLDVRPNRQVRLGKGLLNMRRRTFSALADCLSISAKCSHRIVSTMERRSTQHALLDKNDPKTVPGRENCGFLPASTGSNHGQLIRCRITHYRIAFRIKHVRVSNALTEIPSVLINILPAGLRLLVQYQNGARCISDYLFSVATKDHSCETVAWMRRDHDEVDLSLFCGANNLLERHAVTEFALAFRALSSNVFGKRFKSVFDIPPYLRRGISCLRSESIAQHVIRILIDMKQCQMRS